MTMEKRKRKVIDFFRDDDVKKAVSTVGAGQRLQGRCFGATNDFFRRSGTGERDSRRDPLCG